MDEKTFQRARRPEQISARREAILAAAAELFDAEGPGGAGLNAIAARAGFAKSNVYRYFESREAVLISLHQMELAAMTDAVEARLARCAPGDLDAAATAIAECYLERPRLGRLLSVLTSMLEENVSREAILAMKRESLGLIARLLAALNRVLPDLSPDECAWAWMMGSLFFVGLWPAAHPSPAAAEVLAMDEFCVMKVVAERDAKRGLLTILRGIVASKA